MNASSGSGAPDWYGAATRSLRAGRMTEARDALEHCLALDPDFAPAVATLLATAPDPSVRDGARAEAHARRALQLGVNGAWLDTLAATLAERGEYERAAEVEQRALDMSRPPNPSFRQRLTLYRRRKPWRQTARR